MPMLFVQEEYYPDLASDVKSANNITVDVALSDAYVTEIMDAYDELIPAFIENKASVTVEDILAFIGQKIEFNS